MSEPVYPIYVVDADGLVYHFHSLNALRGLIEAMDVVGDSPDHVAWDTEGRELRFSLMDDGYIAIGLATESRTSSGEVVQRIHNKLIEMGCREDVEKWPLDLMTTLQQASSGKYEDQPESPGCLLWWLLLGSAKPHTHPLGGKGSQQSGHGNRPDDDARGKDKDDAPQ